MECVPYGEEKPAALEVKQAAGSRLNPEVVLIGRRAMELLTDPGFSGEVLSVLSQSVYIRDSRGEVLWLGPEGEPIHPRAVLAAFSVQGIRKGQPVRMRALHLLVGHTVALDFAGAPVWAPASITPRTVVPLSLLQCQVRQLIDTLEALGHPEGLGAIIPLIPKLAAGQGEVSDPSPLLAHALAKIRRVVRASLDRDLMAAVGAGQELLGLGPGLTPSGDDFVGGLLFAAHSLASAYPGHFAWPAGSMARVVARACRQTNPISSAFLGDMASGEGPEPVHALVLALFTGQDPQRVLRKAAAVVRIGHSSGWDTLAGLVTGLLTGYRFSDNVSCS